MSNRRFSELYLSSSGLFFMSAKCGGRGLEIAGYKKRCSISELPVVIAHVLFVLNGIFAGPLKENEKREKMA